MTYYNWRGEPIPPARGTARGLVELVRFYQKHLSPLKLGSTCRFEPTCSAFAVEAISIHGPVRGTALALARICKCGPWHPGGIDPVPKDN